MMRSMNHPKKTRNKMKSTIYITFIYLFMTLASCASTSTHTLPTEVEVSEDVAEREALARPEAAWVRERVEGARGRLSGNEAGRLLWSSIEAHGGLERWYENGPITFRFRYAPVDETKPARDTFQTVDTWSSRARHNMQDQPSHQFGWDGEVAWSNFDASAIRPRFWALTPYYFVGIPFVLADEGVVLRPAGTERFEERDYDLIHASFEGGTGDAPDDYYIVYIDRETKRVGGVRYVVSYPGFFPDGGHTPEKLMSYDGSRTVDGIILPESYRTFSWDTETALPGDLVTKTTLSDVGFEPQTPDEFFDVPEGAEIVSGY